MKKLILLPAVALALFASCSKDDGPVGPTNDGLDYKVANMERKPLSDASVEPASTSLRDSITVNTTLKAGKTYTLENFVFVRNGATLTIEAGAKIVGNKANKGSLIITRNGRIDAQGTSTNPIIFTSAEASPARGDWGGIVILGNAKTNGAYNGTNGLQEIEGGVNPSALGYGLHGGNNDADNSGIMKYVRIEYAGIAFQPNSEINGLTMGSVGNGTRIDYIEVYHCGDDSYEWFGGSVNCSHLISINCTDDDFDSDNGFSGKVQYGISIRDNQQADFAAGGTSNGFESDNNATGTAATPQTSAVFANFTMIGPKAMAGTPVSQYGRGAHIRRNSSISLLNVAMIGWNTGVRIDGQLTNDAARSGSLELRNLIVANASKNIDTAGGITANGIDPVAFFSTNNWGNVAVTNVSDAMITNVLLGASLNLLPTGGPMLAATSLTSSKTAGLETANYSGAVSTSNADWYKGWTKF